MPIRITALLLVLVVITACQKPKTNQVSRVANLTFSWSPNIVHAKENITFVSSANSFHENNLTWEIDGKIYTDYRPTVTFPQAGTYTVTQWMTDDPDNRVTKEIDVAKHIEQYSYRGLNVVGETINFFTIGVEPTANVLWDFGDGTTGTGHTPTHVYSKAGEYHLGLYVDGVRANMPHYATDIVLKIINKTDDMSKVCGGRNWKVIKQFNKPQSYKYEYEDQITITYIDSVTIKVHPNATIESSYFVLNKNASSTNKLVFGELQLILTYDVLADKLTYYREVWAGNSHNTLHYELFGQSD